MKSRYATEAEAMPRAGTNSPWVSIVVPVYRSAATLPMLVQRIAATMESFCPNQYELILVNDCSPDSATWPTVAALAREYRWLRGIDLLYNVGQFNATLCGLEAARGENIVTLDDDLQHPPEEIPVLLRALQDEPQTLCVMGLYKQKRHGPLRNMGSRVIQLVLNRLYGTPSGLKTGSFRAMRRDLACALLSTRTIRPQIGPLIVSLTKRIKNVPVQHEPRERGRSNYSLWRLANAFVETIVYGTTAPLRLFSFVGFSCILLSLLMTSFYLVRWLTGSIHAPGFMTNTLLLIFFGGATLAGLGVLGEYVGRIVVEVAGPRRYAVRTTTNDNDE